METIYLYSVKSNYFQKIISRRLNHVDRKKTLALT
uniref:Uncharacterized protein n=1 Tax=Candidatus Methanophaga sp. ANME-1 ERB7 TaxID=2759913 RepID=A0A7G9ZC20_9EURY|nr:hypothetical protein OHAEDELL_00032 [Methanosarcinales archaeon ANME-1 ERB7]